ncbi:hypothetical protein PENSPDRAFT_752404 [Peniophora sp. CONT]|nr:hypothetical protein PENSPDRAFT_752404 [Peniophora sp. CONT]
MSSPNSTLTDSDIETLSSIGHATVENIVCLVVEAILYTIYFVLVVILGRILLNSKSRTKMSIVIFAIILSMLMLDTAICIIDVHNAIRTITSTLYPTSSGSESLTDRYDNLTLPWMVENALTGFMANLGDIIIIWRTWVFYRGPCERWVLLIPISLLVGSLTSSSLLAYCVTEFDPTNELGDFADAPFCANLTPTQGFSLELASMVLATTFAATAMICWKTWIYRRTIGSNLRLNKKTRAEKVMVILIESGVLYALFFLQVVISSTRTVNDLELSTPRLQFATNVWTYMTNHIMGVYPVIVVILVRSQRSYIENVASTNASLSTHLSESHSFSERHSKSLPSHRLDHGTSTFGTGYSNCTPPSTPRRGHFLDLDVGERRQIHDELSLSDVSGMRGDADDAEVQSVKLRSKEVTRPEIV